MRSHALRLVLLTAIAVGGSMSASGSALAADQGGCTTTLNGVEVERIASLNSPLELSATDTVVFAGTGPTPTETVRVALIVGPITVDSGSTTYLPAAAEFSASLDLDEVSPYGVGLFRVRGSTDQCVVEVWLRISGRSPLTTLTGLTAAGLALGGLTGLLGAVASRRRWSRIAGAAGGLFVGGGGAVLGQQFGRLQLSYPSLAISALGAAGLGYLLGGLLRPDRAAAFRDDPDLPEDIAPTLVDHRPGPMVAASAPAALRSARPEPPASSQPPTRSGPAVVPPEAAAPYWCYVLAEVDVFDLTDHTRIVARLRPGSWYLCKREIGAWAHVASGDGPDGWVARGSVHRQG